MSVSSLLTSLRIPELGPSLGKLVTGSVRQPGGLCLDRIRLGLTTRVLEAGGEARRLAANEEPAAALEAIGPATWQAAWDAAVSEVAEVVVRAVDKHLSAEAQAVRMPRRLRRRLGPTDDDRRALAARLGARGAHLVPALDSLELHGARAVRGRTLERASLEAWQEALKLAARRLEAAWLDLEVAVDGEVTHWKRLADRVGRWRRPLWPVMLLGMVGIVVATWLGLVFGGYIESPDWLSALWRQMFAR